MPTNPRPSPRPYASFTTASIVALVALLSTSAVAQDPWDHQDPQVVVEGLYFPTDLAFGRDGYVYFTLLQDLEIQRASLETHEVDEDFRVEFPDATWQSGTETGLHSLALDPEFHENGVMYVSYASQQDGDWVNVLSRVTLQDETGAALEEVLLTRPGNEFYNGGRVMVADGHLWWTTGDILHWMEDNPQDSRSQEDGVMIGKVLRLSMDGEPAEGNPWDDAAYTKGHRNVFGIAWDPQEQRAFITENADSGPDYVQILEAGGNYGWPDCEGFCDPPQEEFRDPIWQAEMNIAPTGATWFRGAFWFGSFNQGDLYRAAETNGEWNVEKIYHYPGTQEAGPAVLGVTPGADRNTLWFTTIGEIVRMEFPQHDDWPPQELLAEAPYWWDRDGQQPGSGFEEEDPDENEPTPGPAGVLLVVVLAALLVARRRNP